MAKRNRTRKPAVDRIVIEWPRGTVGPKVTIQTDGVISRLVIDGNRCSVDVPPTDVVLVRPPRPAPIRFRPAT